MNTKNDIWINEGIASLQSKLHKIMMPMIYHMHVAFALLPSQSIYHHFVKPKKTSYVHLNYDLEMYLFSDLIWYFLSIDKMCIIFSYNLFKIFFPNQQNNLTNQIDHIIDLSI